MIYYLYRDGDYMNRENKPTFSIYDGIYVYQEVVDFIVENEGKEIIFEIECDYNDKWEKDCVQTIYTPNDCNVNDILELLNRHILLLLRRVYNLTQNELSQIVGISRNTVARIEAINENMVNVQMTKFIAAYAKWYFNDKTS